MPIRSVSAVVWVTPRRPSATSEPSWALPPPSASGHSQASALASSASQPKRASPGHSVSRTPLQSSGPWVCRANKSPRR
nr:MAG TPA: hypothetical protein [Caudoviricetes sp.]